LCGPDNRAMNLLARRGVLWCSALVLLGGCSPAYDWRDVRPAGTQLALQFPCRPVAQRRAVALAGPPVDLSLLACTAGGQTWALAHADLGDPARVTAALAELRSSTIHKLNAEQTAPGVLAVPGATPNVHSGRVRLLSRPAAASAAYRPLQMELAVFARGTHVFQVSVLGEAVPVDISQTSLLRLDSSNE
jgi:hypothetical protein